MLPQWGKRWLLGERVSTVGLRYSCGNPLACEVVCSEYPEQLKFGSIENSYHVAQFSLVETTL
jgi:hypothetical protein